MLGAFSHGITSHSVTRSVAQLSAQTSKKQSGRLFLPPTRPAQVPASRVLERVETPGWSCASACIGLHESAERKCARDKVLTRQHLSESVRRFP